MASGLDMSLDDMIAKNRKSRGGPVRGSGPGSGSGPGPARRIPNRKSNRSAPYASAKAPESTWEHDMFSEQPEGFPPRSSRSSGGIETGTKLYISNLDYGVMNEDIKELFAEVGDLKRYTVHFDRSGRSKGTAEVVFSRRTDALAAVKKYSDVQLDGKPMKIEIVGTNLQSAAASARPSNGPPQRGGQGRGGHRQGGRGNGRGGRGSGSGSGRGRGGQRPGKGPVEKLSAEDLDADLDKYHSGDMETN